MTWTTLHDACERCDDAKILEQSKLSPYEAFELEDHGSTPLHIAMLCYPRIPVEILKELIRSYPASVGMQDYFGNTPVHVYLKSLPPLTSNDVRAFVPTAAEVVNVFLNEYPKICTIKDKDGFTILHLFCKNALLEESVIRKMIETNPVALTSRTKMGCRVDETKMSECKVNSNLHPVNDAEHRTMANLLELRYMDMKNAHMRDGTYPLHLALGNPSLTLGIAKLIINGSGPEILSMTDKYNRSPLQVANALHAPDNIVRCLL